METIVYTREFSEMPKVLQDRAVTILRDMIDNVYGFYPSTKQLGQVLHEQKSVVEFVIVDGKKLLRLNSESESKLAVYLGAAFAKAARFNPEIQNRILANMIIRNEGTERLKFK